MKINIRFLAILLVCLAVCGGATHFLHGYQVKRNAGVFLDRADRAEQDAEAAETKESHYRKAAAHLRRYLAFRSTDTEARARLGVLLEKLARSSKDLTNTLLVYDTVLRQDPLRKDIRLRAAKLALVLERHTEAMDHLTALGAIDSKDGGLHALYAQCLDAMGRYKEARERYAKAVELPPVEIETYARYAALLRRRLNDPQAADKVMQQMAQSIPTAGASLVLCAYWKEFDKSKTGAERAARALAEAQKRAPDDAEVLLQSASMARATGAKGEGIEEARKFLRRGIELHPREPRMYQALSALEEQAKRRTEAVALLRGGLEAIPAQVDLLWALADLRVADGDESESEDLLGQMKKVGMPQARLDYLSARVLLGKGRWREASDLLERTRPELELWPALVRHTDLLLGQCYEKLGETDQQHVAYHRVVSADPLSVPGNLGLGATLEALGRDDDALKSYQRILRGDGAAQVRLRVARLLIRRNEEQPRPEQQWEEVEQILGDADKVPEEAVEAAVLRARAWAVRGDLGQAEKVLTAARKQHPKEATLWITLATLAEQRKQPDEASKLLDEAERALGDQIDLRLARAAQAIRRDGAKSAPILAILAEKTEKFSEADQGRLWRGLAVAHGLVRDMTGALRLWSRLAERQPNDLGIHIALFDVALSSGDQPAISRAVEEVRRIEGAQGTLWKYARAAQLVEEARAGERDKLVEARGLLAEVMAKRPSWPRAALGLATAEELAGNKELAISRYQQAIDLGDRSAATIRSAVLLLYQRRRFAEAEAMLRKLPRQEALPTDLQRLAAEVSLHSRTNPERALGMAQRAVAEDSKNYRDHLWLGQILSLSDTHAAEAEKSLRKALALADTEPETWVALVRHLSRAGQKAEAEALISKAEAKLPRDKSTLALARCYELVGRLERAKELYRNALAAGGADPDLLTNTAQFYLRVGELAETEKYLTRIIELKARPDDVAWARRTLAFVVYARGDYQQKRRALSMLHILDEQLDSSALQEMTADDLRTRAIFLAAQWERSRRQEAIRLLESLGARQPLTADDQFLLGKIYESVGKWAEGSRRMSTALSSGDDNVAYLAGYIDSLLRHKEWEAAALWLAKLERKQPAALLLVQIKARLLKGQGKDDEAAEAIRQYARNKDADLRRAALLLDSIGQAQEAADLFRRLASDGKRPEDALDLALILGRQGRTAEALETCERAATCKTPDVAGACIRVLYAAPDPASHCARVERWFEQAARKETQVDFTPHRAALRNIEGKYTESALMYRTLLAKDPRNVLFLNNLAFLLAAHEGKAQDALALLQQARDQTGPSVDLCDTRAIVYLKLGETDRAIQELEQLVGNAPLPAAYFHLAQAHEAAGDRGAARVALVKARDLKLKLTDLHPLEQPAYQQMLRRLGGS